MKSVSKFVALLCVFCCSAAFGEDLQLLEEAAVQAAVQIAAPSVVRIETVGGKRTKDASLGAAPTTGLVISVEGQVVASAHAFAHQPSSILVVLADGSRLAARLVATDHSRLLVLLKVEADGPLSFAEAVPENEIHVGQWAIAIGRTFDGPNPNVSVGLVSALARIGGKAIQTDAKISPANYGGPLIDIRGRVLGVLAPLVPQDSPAAAGVDWYDAGIGFAVPLAHIQSVLPKLAEGTDLHGGILGINLRGADPFAEPAVIAACHPNSPAYNAGLKADDRIIEADGLPIERQAQLKQHIGRLYAGDSVKLVVLRGEVRIERELELIAKLEPYRLPFLGMLPLRDAAGDAPGVVVRYVYPDGGAVKAGIMGGDRLTAINGAAIASRAELLEKIAAGKIKDKVRVGLTRGDESLEIEVALGHLPDGAPAELPPARADRPAFVGERPAVGRQSLKLPEAAADAVIYIPEAYDPAVPHGIVVWLSPGGGYEEPDIESLVALWKPLCDQRDLVLLAPRSTDNRKWDPGKDLALVRKQLDHLRTLYNIDAARIVACGHQGGGGMASVLAFSNRDLIRGVAAIESAMAGKPPENEPIYPLAFYLAAGKSSPGRREIDAGVKLLRGMKYPVAFVEMPEAGVPPTQAELAEIVRWIDALDRI